MVKMQITHYITLISHHYACINVSRFANSSSHYHLPTLFSIKLQSWYQEMSRLKDKLESLQHSQRYKYYSPFLSMYFMIINYDITWSMKSLWKRNRNSSNVCVSHSLISMRALIKNYWPYQKLLVVKTILTCSSVCFKGTCLVRTLDPWA